jgi:hypothetical protein
MLCGGRYLAQRQAIVLPSYYVPGIRNLDIRYVATAFNLPATMNFEQLGVQRPAIKLKHQLGDTRANR